jgi:hypothetical protein
MTAMRARLIAIAALLCVGGSGVVVAHASAAGYHAYLCRVPYGPNAGKPAPTDGTTYTHSAVYTSAAQDCAAGGAMNAVMDGAVPHPYGDNAAVVFTAPAGLTIAAFTFWRHETAGPFVDFGAPVTNATYTGAETVDSFCARSFGCAERGNAATPLAPGNIAGAANLSGVTGIRWEAACGGGPGGTCPANPGAPSALYQVLAADIVLNDPVPPAVTGVAGPLVAGGILKGAQSVSFNATDAGSGVSRGSLVVDGTIVSSTVLDANGGACAELGVSADALPAFVHTQPCPPAVSGLLTLDTDRLTPGTHALTIRVGDAAGNEAIASTNTISVVGSVPIGSPNGTGASRSAKLTARHATTRKRARRVTFTTRPTITGRVVDEAGSPIAVAAVDVLARDRRAGARTTRIATATTGGDGTFRVTLPSGPSRNLTVQYTAFSGDASPAAAVKLTALVRAQLSASVSPRAPRVGQLLRLNGRLRYMRRARVDVTIQARRDGVWRTADTVKTRSDGRFSWPYRFRRGQAGRTFVFRARVNSAIYPFAAGNSKAIRVRVRG